MPSLVSTWFGAYLVEGDRVVRAAPAPLDPGALAQRGRLRRAGAVTPEEEELLTDPARAGWTTRDRRLADRGPAFDRRAPALPPSSVPRPDAAPLRLAMLEEAAAAIADAWDPSIHVEEAVRAAADLDRVGNLLGERIGSWVSRDSPEIDPGDHDLAVRRALEGGGDPALAPVDPGLADARRRLADSYRALRAVRESLAAAVSAAAPQRTPNLTALLGPELASRLVAQAGGLERLARLPSSTVQVLGAETAFFEHLRGRAPPPRHGLLFLHPAVQGAGRRDRGRLARTLAGKVAIAARLDRGGAPVDPSLSASFEARRARLASAKARPGGASGPRRSRKPLDRAARDR